MLGNIGQWIQCHITPNVKRIGQIKIGVILVFVLTDAYRFLSAFVPGSLGVYLSSDAMVFSVVLMTLVVSARILAPNNWLVLSITALLLFVLIDVSHLLIFGAQKSLSGLGPIKFILYHPMLMPLLVLAGYCFYLGSLRRSAQLAHARNFISVSSLFAALHFVYAIVIKLGVITVAEDALNNTLNNNTLSLLTVFNVVALVFFNGSLKFTKYSCAGIILVSVLTVITNETRSALLMLALLAVYVTYKRLNVRRTFAISFIALSFLSAPLVIYFVDRHVLHIYDNYLLQQVFPSDWNLDRDYVINNRLERRSHTYYIFDLETGINKDIEISSYNPNELSSASRLGSNIAGLLYTYNYPFFGIGSPRAYDIKVLASGIHSFIFLAITTGGLVGTFLLFLFLLGQARFFGANLFCVPLLLFYMPMLLFLNFTPIYLAYIFSLNAISKNEKIVV